mgnify:CR=1 FL=1
MRILRYVKCVTQNMECMRAKQKNIELKNPFLVYGYVSPHYFCDREEESKKMLSALSNPAERTFHFCR